MGNSSQIGLKGTDSEGRNTNSSCDRSRTKNRRRTIEKNTNLRISTNIPRRRRHASSDPTRVVTVTGQKRKNASNVVNINPQYPGALYSLTNHNQPVYRHIDPNEVEHASSPAIWPLATNPFVKPTRQGRLSGKGNSRSSRSSRLPLQGVFGPGPGYRSGSTIIY